MSLFLSVAFALLVQTGPIDPFQDYPVDRASFAYFQGVPADRIGGVVRPFVECLRAATQRHVAEPGEHGNSAAARAFVVQQSSGCGYSAARQSLVALLLQNGVPAEGADRAATTALNLAVVSGGGGVRDLFDLNQGVRPTIPRPCPDGSYSPPCPAKN